LILEKEGLEKQSKRSPVIMIWKVEEYQVADSRLEMSVMYVVTIQTLEDANKQK